MTFKDFLKEEEENKTNLVIDIKKDTNENINFRKVIFTGKLQLVLMSLNSNEEIGMEVHEQSDQFFRVDGGSGKVIMGNEEYPIKDGFAFVVPAGINHNIIAGSEGLKVYTIYSEPLHQDREIDKTKEEAETKEEME